MNHEAMVKEGNRLSAILDLQTTIVTDPTTLKEQAKLVMATGEKHKQRLNALAEAMHADCTCGHRKLDHQDQGRGKCLQPGTLVGHTCPCGEWQVHAL